MPEMIWLTPFIHVPKPEDGAELRYSPEAAQKVLDFFGLLVHGQNKWAGQPFQLLPWQEQLIREFYGVQVKDDDGNWVRYRRFLYNEIPKKNGKSEMAAGLGLYHLLADGEKTPNVGIFAVDKENADTIYKCAKYMVEHTAMRVHQMDMIHLMAYTHNGWYGISVLQRASEVIAAGRAAQQYNMAYYQNGGQPSGLLYTDSDLSRIPDKVLPDGTHLSAQDIVRKEWEKRYPDVWNQI